MAENTRSPTMKCSIRTTPRLHEIRSVIEEVSKLPLDTKVTGPEFYLAPECKCNIAFEKCPVYLRVYLCNQSDVDVEIERTIVLYDCNFEKLHVERAKVLTIIANDDVDVIGKVNNRSSYDTLTNDTLIIDLFINIHRFVSMEKQHFISVGDPGRKLREDMKSLLKNPVNSDVYLKVDCLDHQFPVHWSVLCSRSPYFKKMYDTEMVDGVKNSLVLEFCLELGTLRNLVEFLYTADFNEEIDLEELFDLYKAGEKYELMDLTTLCAYRIMFHATPENACEILQFAHKHNENELRIEAMEFIRLKSDAVFETVGWERFKASEPLASFVFGFRFTQLKFSS